MVKIGLICSPQHWYSVIGPEILQHSSAGLPPGAVLARTSNGRGRMTSGVELAFAVLVSLASFLVLVGVLWLVAVPLCGAGPVEVKTVYSHLARSCKKKKKWSYTRIEGTQMYLGAVPRSAEHLQELHGLGVRAVITLNQAWEPQVAGGVGKASLEAGLAHLDLPTPDFSAPTQRDIRQAVAFASEHADRGDGVYVHCNGGRGRSAVCVLAYMIRAKGMTVRPSALGSAGVSSTGSPPFLRRAERRVCALPWPLTCPSVRPSLAGARGLPAGARAAQDRADAREAARRAEAAVARPLPLRGVGARGRGGEQGGGRGRLQRGGQRQAEHKGAQVRAGRAGMTRHLS